MSTESITQVRAQSTPAVALTNVVKHLFSGQPKHAPVPARGSDRDRYHRCDIDLTDAAHFNRNAKQGLEMSDLAWESLDHALEYAFNPERELWVAEGKPEQHIFVDLMVLGREMIKHKAMIIEKGGTLEKESDTDSAALRGNLATPVIEASKETRELVGPGMG